MSYRIARINSLIRQELSELIQHQVKDPRLSAFTAVNEVSISPDLKHARVFISCIATEEEKQNTLTVLNGAAGFFRKELSRNLRLRRIPELSFHWDDSIERGDHLLRLIDEVSSQEPD